MASSADSSRSQVQPFSSSRVKQQSKLHFLSELRVAIGRMNLQGEYEVDLQEREKKKSIVVANTEYCLATNALDFNHSDSTEDDDTVHFHILQRLQPAS